MESRIFIKEAQALITEIKTFQAAFLSPEEESMEGNMLQKRINNLFLGLYNPTLPSAYKLRDVASGAGFYVDPKKAHLIAQFENIR
jgi:hypothetical protein